MVRKESLRKAHISIGICAYNEAENIALLLQALLSQKTSRVIISEIIVVSSGSTDGTDLLVKEFSRKDSKVMLLVQRSKQGKIPAINLFLKKAKSDIVVLENADTIPDRDAIEKLVLPLLDESGSVGLSGARPIVANDPCSFFGFTNHLLWGIHHQLALEGLKISELIAFRKGLVKSLPTNISGDEPYIESEVMRKGFSSRYVPAAKFRLKGPESLGDFLEQRRRCYSIQLDARKKFGYGRPTSNKNLLKMIVIAKGLLADRGIRYHVWAFLALALELVSRMLGSFDYHISREIYRNWRQVRTTKKLV